MILEPDIEPGPEERSYSEWASVVSPSWDEPSGVLVIGTVGGSTVGAVLGQSDPDCYSVAWNSPEVNPFDPATYLPKPLSQVIPILMRVEDGKFYPTIRAFYEAEMFGKSA